MCLQLLVAMGNKREELVKCQARKSEDGELWTPDVDATALATMKLLQRVTMNYEVAQKVYYRGLPNLLW